MTVYIIGVCIAAVLVGYLSPSRRVGSDDLPRVLMVSLGWPILLLAAMAHGCRMFSVKRIAEDAADEAAVNAGLGL